MKICAGWSKETFQKVFIVVMFTLSAIYGTLHYYVMKQKALRDEYQAKIAELQHQIDEAEAMVTKARQEAALRAKVESFVETHRGGMISGDPFAWVVREFSLLAENHPVNVLGLGPAGGGTLSLKNRYDTYSTQIDCEGQFDQIARYVCDLENHFATGQVRTLEISGSLDGNHRAVVHFSLLVVPEPKTIGPVNTPAAQSKEAS